MSDEAWKIRKIDHPTLGELVGAFCGTVAVVEPWIAHIEGNGFSAFPLPDEEGLDTVAILVKPDGSAIEIDTHGLYSTVQYPTAYGSGSTIAQHYLNTGATALEAVRQSIKSNIGCGGRIVAWDIKTRKYTIHAR